MADAPGTFDAWWREGVLYQVYPRSYQDSDGDGSGDLPGLIARLDHLEWLGVDGIWLSPTFPSPNADWGYDVADYCDVHPDFGTLDDVDRLIADAGRRGIRVLLDLVPNHTSIQHPWFLDAASARDSAHRDWYVWADGDEPPNNWLAAFGGRAWTFHEPTGQWYLHNFTPAQPDLNWWNQEVWDAFDEILTFWFDRGVAGFRIDVAHSMIKDRELRDDPPAGDGDHPNEQARGLRQVYSMNRPEGHDVLRHWRALGDARPEPHPIFVGETFVYDLEQLVPFYGAGDDELQLAFNIPFAVSAFEPDRLREIVETMEARLPEAAWPVWMASNHDIGRLATRWANGDEARARVALLILLTLRGTPFLYAGDEIALPDGVIPEERVLDVHDRDGCRTPMPWQHGPNAGFAPSGTRAVAADDRSGRAQRRRPAPGPGLDAELRARADRAAPGRARAAQRRLHFAGGARGRVGMARGDGVAVAVNLADGPLTVEGLAGRIAIATDRARDGEEVAGPLALAPASGVVLRLNQPG